MDTPNLSCPIDGRKPLFLDGLFTDWIEEAAEELARAIESGRSAHAALDRLVRLSQPVPRGPWR